MLAKRIIPCLDVKEGQIVKGIQFKNHEIIGDIEEFSEYYRDTGADELVFYDITASSDGRLVDIGWITKIAHILDIPFCVAGGISSLDQARNILNAGADKISINSPALANPSFITELANEFGVQCIVVGIDSYGENNDYYVYQYTGDPKKTRATLKRTVDWVKEVQDRGAGEIVLNCMNQDGMRQGYDLTQLNLVKSLINIPLIASGGAGSLEDFKDLFLDTAVEGALAASVFHSRMVNITWLKSFLKSNMIKVRL